MTDDPTPAEPAPADPAPADPASATVEPDGGPARPTRDPLMAQVLRVANKIHGALHEWQRDELGERITAEAKQWNAQELVVVACGDIKRGKSSLLNALLDRSELLPVDADVATSIHLVVRYGEQLGITVTRIGDDGEPHQEAAAVADLVDVASMVGDPARREGVTAVEIRLDHPLLARGLVLIDTPGVGGMSRGHRDLTLSALARADALLFTISAQEPVARSELEFLVEASERTERIVLVVTKSDVNSDEVNGQMIAEHRAKLRTFADTLRERAKSGGGDGEAAARVGRLVDAPVVLTSAYLATQAQRRREAGREEQAVRLMERSGLGDLVRLLERSAANREVIRLANLTSLLRSLLADVEREAVARVRATNGDQAVAAELATRQQALEEFGSRQARWRMALGNSITRLQTGASRLVTHELGRVKDHYQDIIEQFADTEQLNAELPADLERSLHSAWNDLMGKVNDDFRSTLGALLAEFDADGMDIVLGALEMPEALRELTGARLGETRGDFLQDGLPVALQTFSFASIANGAAGALGLATGGLGLVAYGIGAALAYPLGRMRRQARERQRVKAEQLRYVNELLFGPEGVAKEFTTELSLRILDLREAVETFLDRRLTERRKQLEAESRELQGLLRAEAGKRQEAQRAASARLAEVNKLRAELEPLQKGVDARLASDR